MAISNKLWHNTPKEWTLFPIGQDPLVPTELWGLVVQNLNPRDALSLRCNHELAKIIQNDTAYWKWAVTYSFSNPIDLGASTDLGTFLDNKRIQQNMIRRVFTKTIIPCLEMDAGDSGITATHLSKKHYFVGSNTGLVECFTRQDGKMLNSWNLNAWPDTRWNPAVFMLTEVNNTLYACVRANDHCRLCSIDLDTFDVRFSIDRSDGWYDMSFKEHNSNLYVLDDPDTIGVYDKCTGQFKTRLINAPEEKEAIDDFTIDQEKSILITVGRTDGATNIAYLRAYDLAQSQELPLKENASEKEHKKELKLLFKVKLNSASEVRELSDRRGFSFENHNIYSFYSEASEIWEPGMTSSKYENRIKTWKIDLNQNSVTSISTIKFEGTCRIALHRYAISGDYAFTTAQKYQSIWNCNNGAALCDPIVPALMGPSDPALWVSAHGASLAISHYGHRIDFEKAREKTIQMWTGKSPIDFSPQNKVVRWVEILDFDIEPPEDSMTKGWNQFKNDAHDAYDSFTDSMQNTFSFIGTGGENALSWFSDDPNPKTDDEGNCSIQ